MDQNRGVDRPMVSSNTKRLVDSSRDNVTSSRRVIAVVGERVCSGNSVKKGIKGILEVVWG